MLPTGEGRSPPDDDPLQHEGLLLLDPSRRFWRPGRIAAAVGAVVVGLVATGLWFLLVRPTPEIRAAELRAMVLEALRDGRWADAEEFARESLTAGPEHADGHALLAEALLSSGRESDARPALDAALRLDPDHASANEAYAEILRREGDFARAEDHLTHALRGGGASPGRHFQRADVRLERGDLGGALEDIEAGLAGEPLEDSPARALLGVHLAEFLGPAGGGPAMRDRADALLRRFGALAGTRGAALDAGLVAQGHLLASRPRTALEVLSRAADTPDVVVLRAEAHRMGSEPEQAELVLRDAIARNDAPALRACLVRLLLEQGRARSAGVEAAEALRVHPADAVVAAAARSVGLATAVASAPDDLLLHALHVRARGYGPVAHVLLQRVMTGPRGDAALRAALALRGEEWLAAGAPDDDGRAALERDLASLRALAPSDPYGLMWAGVVALRRGKSSEAFELLGRAVAASAEPGREHEARAAAYATVGRWADVLEDARAVLRGPWPSAAAAALEVRALTGLEEGAAAVESARRATVRWPEDVGVLAALRGALALAPPASSSAARRERDVIDVRLASARLDPSATRRALTLLGESGDEDPALRAVGADLWEDLAAEWAARERENPGDVRAPLAQARILVRAGRPRQADRILRSAAERFPGPEIAVARARVLTLLGGYDQAEALLSAASARDRSRPDLALETARVLLAAGRTAEGEEMLRGLLAAAPPPELQAEAALELLGSERPLADDAARVEAWLHALPEDALPDEDRRLVEVHVAFARGRGGDAAPVEAPVGASARLASRTALLTARGWLEKGDAARAEDVLVGALASAPRHAGIRALLAHVRLVQGDAAFVAGDLREAAGHFERAVTGSELDVLAAAALADVLLRRDDVPAAFAASRRLAAARGGSPGPPMVRGYLETGRGRTASALAEFEEALLRAPTHPAVLAAYAEAAHLAGSSGDAERACRRAVDAGDRLGIASFLLGRELARRGEVTGAEAAFRRAVARDPANFGAVAELAALLRGAGRADEARAFVAGVRPGELPPTPTSSRFERLRLYVENGPVLGAADRLHTILRGEPGSTGALVSLGSALLANGDAARAVEVLESALRRQPGDFAASVVLLRALSDVGRLDDAERRLRERTEAAPADPGAWCLLGMIEEHRGRADAAERSYRRALAADAGSALAANNLACVLAARPETRAEALELIARSAHAMPQEPHLAATHAWILLGAGSPSAALAVLEDATRRHPGHALLRVHMAEALRRTGREKAAADVYAEALRLDAEASRHAGPELRELTR